MITCNFSGGLGNNLFQLATTYAMHKTHGFDMVVPDCVDRGNIEIYNQEPRLELNNLFDNSFAFSNIKLPAYIHPDALMKQYEYAPIPVQDNVCYHGYFQSEKYFLQVDITKYLKLKQSNIDYIHQKYSHFFNKKNISIHYRLAGDRVTPHMQFFHKDVSIDYYKRALDLITDYNPDRCNILVFSDNMPKCKILLQTLPYKFEFIEGESNVTDFTFMSLCNLNIVGNSTFSWWSAYLNQHGNKQAIVTSTEWFGPGYSNFNLKDVFPKTWIKL